MTPGQMKEESEIILDDARGQNGGDPAVASLQAGAMVSATLWKVGAEICARLDDIQKSITTQAKKGD